MKLLSVNKKCFSILELIFAILIISILAVIAVPKLVGSKDEAVVSVIHKDISTIVSAVQSYYLLNGNITQFSEAVTLSTKYWKGNNTSSLSFDYEDKNCVTIQIINNQLQLSINETSSEICSKLHTNGVVTQNYTLN